jgi:hypothetical protein
MASMQGEGIKQLAMRGRQKSAQLAGRLPQSIQRHPYRTAGAAMMVAGGVASGRRRSGLDKVQGRPTGIYGY